jgi:hypothetical protein
MIRTKDELFRTLVVLDGHLRADDVSPADANTWKELRHHLVRMQDGLGLARLELESDVRPPEERVRKALQHCGLGSASSDNRYTYRGDHDGAAGANLMDISAASLPAAALAFLTLAVWCPRDGGR